MCQGSVSATRSESSASPSPSCHWPATNHGSPRATQAQHGCYPRSSWCQRPRRRNAAGWSPWWHAPARERSGGTPASGCPRRARWRSRLKSTAASSGRSSTTPTVTEGRGRCPDGPRQGHPPASASSPHCSAASSCARRRIRSPRRLPSARNLGASRSVGEENRELSPKFVNKKRRRE